MKEIEEELENQEQDGEFFGNTNTFKNLIGLNKQFLIDSVLKRCVPYMR